jgi:hypothetical protein
MTTTDMTFPGMERARSLVRNELDVAIAEIARLQERVGTLRSVLQLLHDSSEGAVVRTAEKRDLIYGENGELVDVRAR